MNLPSFALQRAYYLALDENVKVWDTVAYASNFTTGNEDLLETRGTGSDGQLIGDLNDVYKFTLDDTLGVHFTQVTDALTLNTFHRITFDYYIPSEQYVDGIRVRTGAEADGVYDQTVLDEWTSVTINNWAPSADENLLFYAIAGGDDFWDDFWNFSVRVFDTSSKIWNISGGGIQSAGDVFYLKNIIVRTGQPVSVYDVVPPDTDYPYVVLTGQNVIETNFNTDKRLTEIITDVDVVTGYDGSFGGKQQMYEISDQVIGIIRKVPGSYLSLEGFTMLTSTLDSTVAIQEQSETNVLFINRLRFRHKIQEN